MLGRTVMTSWSVNLLAVPLSFNNANSLTYGSWNQFAYSNQTDVVTPGFQNDLSSFAGGGAGGSKTFGVGFMDQSGGFDPPTIRRQAGDARLLESIKVTNTTYAALSMRDGDDFAKAFGGETGNDPDFFLLEITGRDIGGALIDSVDVFLADYRFVDNTDDYILDEWIEVDLSQISNAESIEFRLSSSDVGDFGMNTPAYFAIDDIVLTEQVLPFDLADSNVLESDGDSATTARVSRPYADTANGSHGINRSIRFRSGKRAGLGHHCGWRSLRGVHRRCCRRRLISGNAIRAYRSIRRRMDGLFKNPRGCGR